MSIAELIEGHITNLGGKVLDPVRLFDTYLYINIEIFNHELIIREPCFAREFVKYSNDYIINFTNQALVKHVLRQSKRMSNF